MNRLAKGDRAPTFSATTIHGRAVSVPDPAASLVHLQFRRFAGCPVCNFHLLQFARRSGEIESAGVREVVVFHSSQSEMLRYQARLPFDCVADPSKRLYRTFGVETSLRALLHPMVLWNGARWVLLARRFYRRAENGVLGLPADFLVGRDGRIVAAKYGRHADDHWSVDELLTLVAQERQVPAQPAQAAR